MKRCQHCNAVYEDHFTVCPTCGGRLQQITNHTEPSDQNEDLHSHVRGSGSRAGMVHHPLPFESVSGSTVIINGAVAETSTQQYYQSKFTKFFHALFAGEPYQLSHTSFVTVFRVEEYAEHGYPEQARDVILYGNMQNIFAVGDDLTVTARRHGDRLIAQKVLNHSINDTVRVQPYISSGVIRAFTLAVITLFILILHAVVSIDYSALGSDIGRAGLSLLYAILPAVITVWVLWLIIKSMFSHKGR